MPKAEIKQKKPAKARASKRKTSVTSSSVAPALSTFTSHISSSSITKSEKSNHVSRDSPVIEKRATRYRKSATKDIIQRIDRAVSQRMYLVDRKEVSSHEHEFAVLGSTGNVYNVKIRRFPECNCPDFEKHKNFSTGHSIPCKHVLFIYLKVLKLERSSHIIYQTSLLQSELEALFARQVSNAVIANEQTIENYKVATGASSRTAKTSQSGLEESRKPIDGDCPICFETMDPNKLDLLTWCRAQCGNNVHKDCFTRWSRASRGPDGATCVYCRCNWVESTKASGTNPKVLYKEGYMNLGNLQGLPSDRDHSSYYDGPRRGHSYGRYNRRSMYNCFDSDGESQDDDY
ncbi:hypothetical protein BKA69DRAFT_1156886 [Paraphysoderma sedebokerense]|nr:hypothetical protein BKA69DRAFT_1156886 [Paraphysoderma sedebokerense]